MISFREGLHQLHNDYEADELFLRIFEWIEAKKGKTKWKQPKPFEKSKLFNKKHYVRNILVFIGLLIGIFGAIRKLISCFRKLGKF